jgi:hypothetical protein
MNMALLDALPPPERAVYLEVYPLIGAIEKRERSDITLLLWVNLARKLATRGVPLEQMRELLDEHHRAQREYNARAKH